MKKEIDLACYCEKCVRRTKKFYKLTVRCSNCGWEGIAKIRKGDKVLHSKECPNCKVGWRLVYGYDPKFERERQ